MVAKSLGAVARRTGLTLLATFFLLPAPALPQGADLATALMGDWCAPGSSPGIHVVSISAVHGQTFDAHYTWAGSTSVNGPVTGTITNGTLRLQKDDSEHVVAYDGTSLQGRYTNLKTGFTRDIEFRRCTPRWGVDGSPFDGRWIGKYLRCFPPFAQVTNYGTSHIVRGFLAISHAGRSCTLEIRQDGTFENRNRACAMPAAGKAMGDTIEMRFDVPHTRYCDYTLVRK